MDKTNNIYKILGEAWKLLKPIIESGTYTEDEATVFLARQQALAESFKSEGSAEHKFARDIFLACNNYYQFKYMENERHGK